MSRRTAEASKAIRAAWLKERQLVSDGKGTRDWTVEQQKEILELGKAYYHSDDPDDVDNGKAFEGHHMKSAEAYPEYQGDSDNIQFLSHTEHREAHGGDYRNPTNGYFDPATKLTSEFGDNICIPREIISLTDPVVHISDAVHVISKIADGSTCDISEESSVKKQKKGSHKHVKSSESAFGIANKTSPKIRTNFGEGVKYVVESVKDLYEKHPSLIKGALGIALTAVGTYTITNICKGSGGGSNSFTLDDDSDFFHNEVDDDLHKEEDIDETLSVREYPDERLSPKAHMVAAHAQHYHTKEGVILKAIDEYYCGGNVAMHDDNGLNDR